MMLEKKALNRFDSQMNIGEFTYLNNFLLQKRPWRLHIYDEHATSVQVRIYKTLPAGSGLGGPGSKVGLS